MTTSAVGLFKLNSAPDDEVGRPTAEFSGISLSLSVKTLQRRTSENVLVFVFSLAKQRAG